MDLRWRRFSVLVCLGFLCILNHESKFAFGCRLVFFGNETDVPAVNEFHVEETVQKQYVLAEVQIIDGTVAYDGDPYLGLVYDSSSDVYSLQFIIPIGDDYDKGVITIVQGSLKVTCDDETETPIDDMILVFIDEVNTHEPVAKPSELTLNLPQNLPVGLDLRQFYSTEDAPFYVQDEDRDDTPSSSITFELDNEFLEVAKVITTYVDYNEKAKIMRYTPVITLKKSLELATEPTFTATLIAKDEGEPQLQTSIPITVNVQQTNDGAPKFAEFYYTSEVLRTASAGPLDINPRIYASVENDPSVPLTFRIVHQPENGPQFSIQSHDNYVDLYLENDVDPSWPDRVVHVVIEAARKDNSARTDTVAVTIVFTDPVTTTTSTTLPTTEMTTLCPTEPPCPTVTCPACPTVTEVTCETVPPTQPMTCPTPEPCVCPTAPPTEPVTCPTLPITTETTCPECICTTEHITTNPTTNPTTSPSTNTTTDNTRTTDPVGPTDPTVTTCPPCPSSTPGFSTTLASTSTSSQGFTTVTPNDLTTFCQSIVTCDCTTPVTLSTTQSTESTFTTNSGPTTRSDQSSTSTGSTQSSQSTSTNGSTQSSQSTTNGSTQSSQSTASNAPTQSTSTQHFTGSSSTTSSYGTTVCPPPEPCTTVSPFTSTCAPCDCTTTVSVSTSSQGTTLTSPTSTACPTPTPCDCTTTSGGTTSTGTTSSPSTTTVTSSTTTQAPTPPPATVYFERSHYAAEFLSVDTNAEVEVLTVKAIPSNPADQVVYTLTGDDSVIFTISENGLITMLRSLVPKSYNFKARATIPSGAFDETDVTVHVIANVDPDGPPRFNQSVYLGALKEYETSDHVAQVVVWDDTNVVFEIGQVSPSNLRGNFNNNGPVITCVQPVSRANATSVQVTLWATRNDQISEVMVYIPIEDVNDKPSFPRTSYVIGYPKRTYIDQTVSMPIYRFQAVDNDVGNNSVLAYELTSSSGDNTYFVESSTGTLYASYSDSEDHCQSSVCKYTITARDLNGAGLAATADVSIRMLTEEQIQTVSVNSAQVVDVAQIATDLSNVLGYNVEPLHATVSSSTKRVKASGERMVVYLYAVDSKANFLSRDAFTKDVQAHSGELEGLDWQLESTNEAALPSYAAQDVISDLEASKADLTVATGVLGAFLGLAVLGALGFVFFVYYWKDGHFRFGTQKRRDSMEKHQKILASSRLPEDETNGSLGHGGLQNHAYTEKERPSFAESDKITSIRDEVIVTVQPPTPEVKTDEPYLPPVEDEIYSPESPKPKKSIIKTDTAPDDKKDGGATNGSKSIKFNPNPDVIQLSSTGGAIINTESVANNPNIEMEAL